MWVSGAVQERQGGPGGVAEDIDPIASQVHAQCLEISDEPIDAAGRQRHQDQLSVSDKICPCSQVARRPQGTPGKADQRLAGWSKDQAGDLGSVEADDGGTAAIYIAGCPRRPIVAWPPSRRLENARKRSAGLRPNSEVAQLAPQVIKARLGRDGSGAKMPSVTKKWARALTSRTEDESFK